MTGISLKSALGCIFVRPVSSRNAFKVKWPLTCKLHWGLALKVPMMVGKFSIPSYIPAWVAPTSFCPHPLTETMHQDIICSLSTGNFHIRVSAGQIPVQQLGSDMSFEIIKRSRWINVFIYVYFWQADRECLTLKNESVVRGKKQDLLSIVFNTLCFLLGAHNSLD